LDARIDIPEKEGVRLVDGCSRKDFVIVSLNILNQPSDPENVIVEMEIRNRVSFPVEVYIYDTPLGGGGRTSGDGAYDVRNQNGERPEYIGLRTTHMGGSPTRAEGGFVVIDKGSSIKGTTNIAKDYRFKPGKYSIQFLGNYYDSLPISNIVHVEVKEKADPPNVDNNSDSESQNNTQSVLEGAKEDFNLELKIANVNDGLLVYIRSKLLRRVVNARFALARISKSLTRPLYNGELGLEIVDKDGKTHYLKTLYNRDPIPPEAFFTLVFGGHTVGVSIKYCELVDHYSLKWGNTYRVRAVYSNRHKVHGASKVNLWSEWVEIALPESQECGIEDTTK
jgi:hypothetical protein